MIERTILGILFAIALTGALSAQTPDKKDYVIQAIEAQRNDALTREAICRGETGPLIDDLRRQIEELKKQLAEKN